MIKVEAKDAAQVLRQAGYDSKLLAWLGEMRENAVERLIAISLEDPEAIEIQAEIRVIKKLEIRVHNNERKEQNDRNDNKRNKPAGR